MSRMIDDEEALKDNGLIEIDGCNVAECDCYDNTYCLWSKKYHEIRITPKCEIVKDCYFKQLQRAKAENEKLENRNNLYKKIIVENLDVEDVDDFKNYAKFHQENKKLKKALEDIREDLNNSCWESADIGIRNRILNKIDEVLNNK